MRVRWFYVLLAGLVFSASSFISCTKTTGEAEENAEAIDTAVAADVPIQRVVLYRSGIAYVERFGEIDGDTLTLQIQPDQINDILTTLTILVDGGENVASSIGLPIERSVAQDLDSLPPQVRQSGGMMSLLNAFRGAAVHIEAVGGSADGRVVGTEALVNDEGNQIRYVTLMTEEGELRQFRIDEIRDVALENDTLELGLSRSLNVSLGEGDWKPVELKFHLSGDGPHDVFVSYVVEMPTWKPTYRIIVDDGEVHLQGWAVVDNISGEDWEDIELSLVAGTPISFQYDLHSPRFVSRPDLTARGFADGTVMAPTVDDGVMLMADAASAPRGESTQRERRRSRPSSAARTGRGDSANGVQGGFADPWAESEEEPGEWRDDDDPAADAFDVESQMLIDGMANSAETQQFDNLFRYDVGYSINVEDRSSALVTVVNEPLDGEDILYFDPQNAQAGNNPYRAIRLTNDTGFTIERGPLSIFKDSTFVGQAIGPRIGESEMVFLPYSVDGRFRIVERQSNGTEGVRLVRIVNSIIFSEVQNISRRTYQITNNSGQEARLYVRVPKRTNWNLTTPAPDSGVIDQGAVWYVPIELDGEASHEFTVETATNVTRRVEIWDAIAADTIGLYLSNPDAAPEIKEQLEAVLEQRARIAEIERELITQRRLRTDAYGRMSEIRQNLEALGDTRQSRDLRRTLTRRLGDQEDQATAMTVTIVSLEEEEAELRARISTALMDLELADTTPTAEADDE